MHVAGVAVVVVVAVITCATVVNPIFKMYIFSTVLTAFPILRRIQME